MNTLVRLYFRMLGAGALLLTALLTVSPAKAELGFSGIEISPVRIFASANSDDYTTFSGTLNFELANPLTELAVPVLWTKDDDGVLFDGYEALVVDVQWRKFDKPARDGGYVGVMARAVNARSADFDNDGSKNRATDFGVGVLAGFRRNISTGFYWGANINLVAFASEPKSIELGEHEFFRQRVSLTLDFLKIGYRF